MEPSTPPPPPTTTEKKHPLELPAPDVLREIARRQDEAAQEIRRRRTEATRSSLSAALPDADTTAAELIQRNYRGYRARRALQGRDLDPSTRWVEVRQNARRLMKSGREQERKRERVCVYCIVPQADFFCSFSFFSSRRP